VELKAAIACTVLGACSLRPEQQELAGVSVAGMGYVASARKVSGRAAERDEEVERMFKTIYVGNLPFSATEEELRELFGEHGTVTAVRLITNRETGRPRGFGFVDMAPEGADVAVEALDGAEFGGRTLRISEAKQRHDEAGARGC